jgi:hypothetical protein
MNSVSESRAGLASGINNAVSRTAGLLAVAVLSIVLLHTFNSQLDRHFSSISIIPEAKSFIDSQRVKLAGAQAPTNISIETQLALKRAVAESFVFAFRRVMLIAAALALFSALSAWLLITG